MKLKEYLDLTGIPTAKFARRCKLTYPQVRHILLGNHPTLETALKIEKFTFGKVTVRDMVKEEVLKEIFG